mgnify:CR=1 FL=1
MKIDLTCPVELWHYALPTRQYPVCHLQLFNLTEQTVTSLQVVFACYDAQGALMSRQVERIQAQQGLGRSAFEVTAAIDGGEQAEGLDFSIEKVWFEDGTVWRHTAGNVSEYTSNALPAGRRLDVLRYLAGSDALGYPSDQGAVWMCVCGRPNSAREDTCRRCGRLKRDVFTSFNEAAVETVIFEHENAMEEKARRERAEAQRVAEQREAEALKKRNRRRKITLIVTGSVTALVLTFGVYFHGIPFYHYYTASRQLDNGVYTAAQGYFGKSLGELTLRECAMLAGTCNSPYYYNPRRNFYTRQKEGVDYPAITNDRTNYVLRCMYENQYITYEQYQEALDPATAHVLEKDPNTATGMYAYAHYVEYAVDEVIDILLQLNNLEDTSANRNAMENKLRTGGYHVQLAIDTSIQSTVEDTLENWTNYPSLRDPADKVYRTRNSDGTYDETVEPQAAAVVVDYHTGEIKAIVGSRTRPTAMKTFNRAVDMTMPVGSSIKPIAVYAPAIELGASPASIVMNMPLPISGWRGSNGQDSWPRNYGGSSYAGPETLRKALVNSHNTAAAQALMTLVGVDNSVAFLHAMGIDDAHIDATPFGLSLGSSGITPMQMAVAFGVLANGGVYQQPISVLGISDSTGKVIWDGHQQQERHRVFSESTAYMVVDMLKQAVSSGTGTNAKIKGQTVAGKTGTNSDQKGVFFAGMTGYYSSALWVGHDNYKALSSKSTGSRSAAPLWQSYMSKIHQGLSNRDILEGSASDYGLVKVTTCAVSGQLATDACRSDAMGYGVVTDYWKAGTEPTVSCQMHTTQTICSVSGLLASPYCPDTVTRGVLTIPSGHPLASFIGTEYEDVLIEYLGSYAVLGASGTCPYHTSASSSGSNTMVENTLIPDAKILLSQAYAQLQSMDIVNDAQRYSAIQSAITNLEYVISLPAPTTAEVASAMGQLTQAMAGLY